MNRSKRPTRNRPTLGHSTRWNVHQKLIAVVDGVMKLSSTHPIPAPVQRLLLPAPPLLAQLSPSTKKIAEGVDFVG